MSSMVVVGLHIDHRFAHKPVAAPAALGALLDHIKEYTGEIDVVCGDLNFTRAPGGRTPPTAAPAVRLFPPPHNPRHDLS